MNQNKFIYLLIVLCIGLFYSVYGNKNDSLWQWQAEITAREDTGYYKIPVIPEISGRLSPDYADVRLFNHNGREIPYFWRHARSSDTFNVLKGFKMVSSQQKPGCCSHFVFRNVSEKHVEKVFLRVHNANVYKKLTIQGSDDQQQWYVVEDRFGFNPSDYIAVRNKNELRQIPVRLPTSNYKFYKVTIFDSLTDPLKVHNIGFHKKKYQKGDYFHIPANSVVQKDSRRSGKSFVTIHFDHAHYIDDIQFHIKDPLYHRICKLYKIKKDSTRQLIRRFMLSSRTHSWVNLQHIKAETLQLIIDNEDSPPLQISSVAGRQCKSWIIAKLDANKQYTMKFGHKEKPKPEYDLKHFNDQIPKGLPVIKPRNIHKKKYKTSGTNEFHFLFSKEVWLWIVLILVMGILGYLTYKITRNIS